MFARKMDASFRSDDLIVEQGLLAGIKEGECTTGVGIVVPHVRGACLEFLPDLRMDDGDIFNCLFDPFVRQERTPALCILRPGIACQKNSPTSFLAVISVVQITNGKIGHSAATVNAVIFLPEASACLEED